jgi:hypothetical protein
MLYKNVYYFEQKLNKYRPYIIIAGSVFNWLRHEKREQIYFLNRETGKIWVGEQVMVLRMENGKDFRAWKSRGSAGQEG